MDGGGSKQYHVSLSAKHDIKPVQGCTVFLFYAKNNFFNSKLNYI